MSLSQPRTDLGSDAGCRSATPLQLLLIEDSSTDATFITRRLLKAGIAFEWKQVGSVADLRRALEAPIDLILADYNLPDMDVRAALRLAKRRLPDIPFVIVSGSMGEEIGIEMMKLGADDFLLKDRLGRLGQAVEMSLHRSAQRRQQRALESRYQTMFDESPAGKVIVTIDQMPVRANKAFCRMLGYTEDELRGLSMIDITHPDDRASAKAAYDDLVAGGSESLRIERRYLSKSGAVRWGDVTNTLTRDSKGNPEYVESFILDITGRKAAENALHESVARFRGIVESLPGFVYTCLLDDLGTTTYVSPQVEILLGIPPDEYVGTRQARELSIHPEDRSWVSKAFKESITRRGRFHSEYRAVARDGSVHWLQDHAVVIRDDAGSALYCQGVTLDVSERRQGERALLENEANQSS
jgi:PAS domain S-box-containing protein